MYILPTLTYLEVGEPADASEIICFEHFKWEPIPLFAPLFWLFDLNSHHKELGVI